MYKLLLCLRYLRTRYLAFVCVLSVMLGVATLIVVNSVMSGFSNKLKDRLHGILADVVVETDRSDGFEEKPEVIQAKIAASPVGKYVKAVSPTVEVYALLQFTVYGQHGPIPITKHVRLIGVDPAKHAEVGQFSEYLVRQKGDPVPSFELTPDGMRQFERNLERSRWEAAMTEPPGRVVTRPAGAKDSAFLDLPPPAPGPAVMVPPPALDPLPPPRVPGVVMGFSLAHVRWKDPQTGVTDNRPILRPGDDVQIATIASGAVKPVSGTFAVCDHFKSEMSEYDSGLVYVRLDELQRLRGMDGRVNNLQLRLTDDVRNDPAFIHAVIVPELQKLFPPAEARVVSWQQHQGPLLAAIDIERKILNILLFLIVGVAGFSVLAIFSMIVSEKYRDIGVLKSLGASNRGVMGIFVGYGLLLGLIGCGLGTAAGLLFTTYINEIEAGMTRLSGEQVFDRSVYYFDSIPTNIEGLGVLVINLGAVGTAVLFSVLPAFRAARLHPVRALRFE